MALCLALVGHTLLAALPATAQTRTATVTSTSTATTTQAESIKTSPVSGSTVTVATVNFKELSEKQARQSATSSQTNKYQEIHAPLSIQEEGGATISSDDEIVAPEPPAPSDTTQPNAPSPAPSRSYQAEFDEAKGGGPVGTFTIPPDTMGAVGLDKVFTQVNNNYVVQDKTTGARLSVVSPDAFWAPTGATGVFDPRVQFDRFTGRWLVNAVSSGGAPTSSVLIGISNTSDPQGTYTLFRFQVGCAAGTAGCNAGGEWADFPMLGYNQKWVTVTWNQFTISTNAFVAGRGIVMDYPALRAGTNTSFTFSIPSSTSGAFCFHPATTYDQGEQNQYFAAHISSAGATYRTATLSGTTASPTLTLNAISTRTGGGWTQPGGDILPQTCVGTAGVTCPTTLRRIDSGDSFIRSNVVLRNGNLWWPQTIGLPAGGLTRTAVQWTRATPIGVFVDGGRVDDPTATATNGGSWYAYPGIAVNKNDDMLLGFSEFESDDFADAGYVFRLATDPAGTTRDPVIYKEGEDYYSKAFSGTRNRWGDYSHAVVDPVNDRDLWTIQEYAGTRTTPDANTTTNNSRWATWWAMVTAPAGAGDLIISEFRERGPNGANDEFIEIYNNNDAPITVNTLDGSAGYSVVAADNVVRFTIPNGTTIPARGHYLGVNSVGYSLASYPAGNGTTATGDATYTTDIPDNTGIAIFRSSTTFDATTRLDSVGFTTTPAGSLFVEGTGIPPLTPFSIDFSFYRNLFNPTGASAGQIHRDTNNNAADFLFVDTNGTSAGAGQRLGAPGPENLSSPVVRNGQVPMTLVDPSVSSSQPPNRVRDITSDPSNNSTFGTLSIRRTLTNNTGAPVTRLRFRIVDITTFPAPSGTADLRARTSTPVVVTVVGANPGCPGTGPRPCTVQGTTLEEPPAQPNGGAFNSTLSAGTVTLATPLAPGASINVQFLLGLQQTGAFRFVVNTEVLP